MAEGFQFIVNPAADQIAVDAIEAWLIDQVGPRIRDNAERAVPVDTSDLKRSIVLQVDRKGADSVIQVGVDTDVAGVDYGRYVEYGTSKSAAQPYLRPAVYQARGRT